MHRFAALALLVLAACHSAPRGGVIQPGAPTPAVAVERFLGAAKSQDLQALSMIWGPSKGPARDVVDKSQIERRELIMICYLNHDTYRVLSEGLAPEGKRSINVELRRGNMARSTTLTIVQGPADRYYVEQAALEPLTDLCAGGVPATRSPAP